MSEQISHENPQPVLPQAYNEADWSAPTYSVSEDLLQQNTQYYVGPYNTEHVNQTLQEIAKSDDTPEQKGAEMDVLVNGKAFGHEVGLASIQRGASDVMDDRHWLANVMHADLETAKVIAEKHIVGFHAANSLTLAGFVEEGGLISGKELDRRGRATPNGQHDAYTDGQGTISFGKLGATEINTRNWAGPNRTHTHEQATQQLHDAVAQAEDDVASQKEGTRGHTLLSNILRNQILARDTYLSNPNSLAATLTRNQFPVVFGVTAEFVKAQEESRTKGTLMTPRGSEWGEFRPNANEIPVNALPVIGVPADRLEGVRKLLDQFGHQDITVVPLESLLRPERYEDPIYTAAN